ncbi:MAG: TRAP transporter small permease [Pseudomonadota bacterium]
MNSLLKITRFINLLLLWIGGICLGGMILLTCANIVMRQIWVPIPGTFEIMGYAGAIAAAFALGFAQTSRSHISVDVLVNTYPRSLKRFMTLVNSGVCCLFFAIAAWYLVQKALTLKNAGELSETLRIIYYPVTVAVALGCLSLALTLLTDFLKVVFPPKGGAA